MKPVNPRVAPCLAAPGQPVCKNLIKFLDVTLCTEHINAAALPLDDNVGLRDIDKQVTLPTPCRTRRFWTHPQPNLSVILVLRPGFQIIGQQNLGTFTTNRLQDDSAVVPSALVYVML